MNHLTESDLRSDHAPVTLSMQQTADILGISAAYGYVLAKSGELPTIKLGNRLRVPTRGLLHLIDAAVDGPSDAA